MTIENITPASPGYSILPIHISGQYTASVADVVKFKLPWAHRAIGVSATARASGGTSPTLSIDVKEAGTTILSSAMSITAGSITDGVISDANLADEAEISIDLTIGGTSPTWDDITVHLVLKRV
ncbi:MAG: hypothetical protein SVY10_19010 [Thermodesulfobacteriota bacterium]|nr:hypothetical protein [Thermodesulfobacteriota bacterium]